MSVVVDKSKNNENAILNQISILGDSFSKEVLKDSVNESSSCNPQKCLDILQSVQQLISNAISPTSDDNVGKNPIVISIITILQQTSIGKTLTKSLKSLRRHKRSSLHTLPKSDILNHDNNNIEKNDHQLWDETIQLCERLLSTWKEAVDNEMNLQSDDNQKTNSKEASKPTSQKCKKKNDDSAVNKTNKDEEEEDGDVIDFPTTIAIYRSRLVEQKKELYKDPPTLPPPSIIIKTSCSIPPKRDKKTGALTFFSSSNDDDQDFKNVLKEFHPNMTPAEVLQVGSFGGTYFRPITSAVTNQKYTAKQVLQSTVQPEWIKNVDKATMLTSSTYRESVNKYKVKCGGSLGMWESSGWISDSDPYGWFQWYCRFYSGRRCSDDTRQIGRWMKSAGSKGRFLSQLCNKCFAAGGISKVNDAKISPVIRQTLLHWGITLTEDIMIRHGKRTKQL